MRSSVAMAMAVGMSGALLGAPSERRYVAPEPRIISDEQREAEARHIAELRERAQTRRAAVKAKYPHLNHKARKRIANGCKPPRGYRAVQA